MGSRAGREAPKDLDKKKSKAVISAAEEVEGGIRRRGDQYARDSSRYADVLQATEDLEGLNYRPKTAETREVYELLLGAVHQALGDQAQDVIRSATDTVLEILKSEDLKEFDRKKEVESIVGLVLNDNWSQLVNLSKKITDYSADDAAAETNNPAARRNIDAEDGVAVLFEDDEDEDEGEAAYEVRDDESADEDMEADEGAQGSMNASPNADEDEEGEILIGNASDRKRAKKQDDQVAPHEIDGFWLQRIISAAYVDPRQANELTSKTMDLLSSDTDLRDLENSLAEVFGYENFEMVALLIKNRDAIVWCTKLARSSEEERHDIEVAMRERGLGWILRALIGDRSGTSQVTSLRSTKQTEVDGLRQPSTQVDNRSQRIIDIESMIFAQGGHTMSNKKVKLPTGSFKRTGKGFEEIHVPIPEKRVAAPDETPVQIASLPEWTVPVWGKTTQLNPVQSKVFPVAFGTDEPMLLCAPTGAGKVSMSALLIAWSRTVLTLVLTDQLCDAYHAAYNRAVPR